MHYKQQYWGADWGWGALSLTFQAASSVVQGRTDRSWGGKGSCQWGTMVGWSGWRRGEVFALTGGQDWPCLADV